SLSTAAPARLAKKQTLRIKIARWGWAGLMLAVGITLVAFLTGCSGNRAAGDAIKPAGRPAVPVQVGKVIRMTVPVQLQVIGSVEAYSTVSVKSMIAGEIQNVNFQAGQDVRKGDLLFSIDPRPFQAALDQARANLARDQAQLQNAQLQDRRYTELYKEGIVSQDQYDQFRSTAAQLEAAVQADQAAVENARIQLSYCAIRSPMDGRLGAILVNQGNLVKANDVPMVVINQIQPIYVDFSAPQQHLSEIRSLMSGRLRVQAIIPHDPNQPEWGMVTFVNNTVDTSTGTIMLKGTFPNPSHRLWPGEYVNVVLTLSDLPNAVVAPSPAVQTGTSGQYAYVLGSNHTVQYRLVTTGESYQGYTVIEKGLEPGETVITDGQISLYPGAMVEVKTGL
ncbi:MAG: efflux RND transporter periplasmic adaptor subunit, partial [Terriglobia bacterium]